MITHPVVLNWLIEHFHLYLLRNITVRTTLAAMTAFALSLLLGPLLICWLQSRQIRERVEKKDSARLTEIHATKNSKGISELKDDAKIGGNVSAVARKELEKQLGRSVVSKKNYLKKPQNKKLLGGS